MPAVLYSGEITNKLPPGLTGIDIKSLTPQTNLRDKYVQATVDHRFKFNKQPVSSLKLVLKNHAGSDIELLAIGQVADDLDICVPGDELICLKFEVEACPGHYRRTCQMVVDDTRDVKSLVWIVKESDKSKRAEQTNKPPRYSYKSLAELKVNTIADVYGVVKFYKPPTRTKGSDYCCTVSLTDPSLEGRDDKFSCNLFSRSEASLPVLGVGDVIRFHRLKIQNYQGRKQGYNGPGFQWLLFRGSAASAEASSASYTFEQHEEDKVKSLLEWWQKNGSAESSITGRKTLSEVQPKEYFDLVCQVIRVCNLEASECKVCRVWDGTKFKGPLKMAKEEEFSDAVLEDGTLMEVSTDLAVDVYFFDNHWKSADSIMPGDMIQLTNLHAAQVQDQVELTLHGGTWFHRGVVVLSRDSAPARDLQAALNTVIKEKTSCDLLVTKGNGAGSTSRKLNGNLVDKSIDASGRDDAGEAATVKRRNVVNSPYVELNAKSVNIVKNYSTRKDSKSGRDLKLMPTSSDQERNELTGTNKEMINFERNSKETSVVRSPRSHKRHTEHDSMEASSDSSQSIWLSAYDDPDFEPQLQVSKGVQRKATEGLLQDSSISSSGTSTDSHCLLSTNTNAQQMNSVSTSPACKNTPQSSQESFHTASGVDLRESTGVDLRESTDVDLRERTGTDLRESTNVDLRESTGVDLRESTGVDLRESTDVDLRESTDVDLRESTGTDLRESTDVDLWESTGADLRESTGADLRESTGVDLRESTSVDRRESTNVDLLKSTKPKSSQKTFLSLKRKLESPDMSRDDNEMPLTVSKKDMLSLNSSVLCFDTAGFTESLPAGQHSQQVVEETELDTAGGSLLKDTPQQSVYENVGTEPFSISLIQSSCENTHEGFEDSDVICRTKRNTLSQSSDKPMRCMLKTASTVAGHTLVARSSLKDVLEHAVPHKFRVLARIQEFKPRPATAANLVHFVCSQCHHIEPVASLQVAQDRHYLDHVCSASASQPVRLQPTIIVTFVLCDEKHSLVAYLWDKQAVQFFCGIEPSQILTDNETSQQIEKWLDSLCPLNSRLADRPLLECCLFSYGTQGSVKYQIFDTVLV